MNAIGLRVWPMVRSGCWWVMSTNVFCVRLDEWTSWNIVEWREHQQLRVGQLIKWERINGIRVEQVASTKFILIDIKDPEQYIEQSSGLKKKLMQGNYKMYGTPVSMASVALQIRFDELAKLIGERLQKRS